MNTQTKFACENCAFEGTEDQLNAVEHHQDGETSGHCPKCAATCYPAIDGNPFHQLPEDAANREAAELRRRLAAAHAELEERDERLIALHSIARAMAAVLTPPQNREAHRALSGWINYRDALRDAARKATR